MNLLKTRGFVIPDAYHMKATSLATVLGVSRQTIGKWDCPRNTTDRTYDLSKVLQWRIAQLTSQSLLTESGGRQSPEMKRLRHIQADREQIKLDIDRGAVVQTVDVDHEWGVLLTRLRHRLVRLPQALMAVLPPATANTAIPIVEREIKNALDDIVREYDKGRLTGLENKSVD